MSLSPQVDIFQNKKTSTNLYSIFTSLDERYISSYESCGRQEWSTYHQGQCHYRSPTPLTHIREYSESAINLLVPVKLRNEVDVDYHFFCLIHILQRYNVDLLFEIPRMRKKVIVQIMDDCFNEIHSICVINLLTEFRRVRDSFRTQENAIGRIFREFMNSPTLVNIRSTVVIVFK